MPASMRPLAVVALALCAGGFVLLAGPAGDWNRLRFEPESPGNIVSLELARDRGQAAAILARWEREHRIEEARRAVLWDCGFLLCYGLGLALICLLLTGGTVAGKAAAAVALAAAAFDAAENAGLLLELGGPMPSDGLAVFTSTSARAKFILLGAVLLYLVLALLTRARAAKAPEEPWSSPAEDPAMDPPDQLRPCDVVMKGGITSGVVYPKAIFALSRKYRFRNVGGASAGAIAAVVAAAAEFARLRRGTDAFGAVGKLPDWLAGGDGANLANLFRPDPITRPAYEVVTAFLGDAPLRVKLGRAASIALGHFWRAALLALIPGALLFLSILAAPQGPQAAAILVLFCTWLLGLAVALVAAFVVSAARGLNKNGFGLSSGTAGDSKAPPLSPWLASLIDEIAFGPRAGETPPPLTFGDLWCAEQAKTNPAEEVARWQQPSRRSVNLEVMTTSLTHGRPFRIPFETRGLYFDPADLRKVLPDRVVAWMEKHPGARAGRILQKLPKDRIPFPDPWDVPVVFAARASLSFPFLLSAVRLYMIDFSRKRAPSGPFRIEPVWLSDGGISSNFPIHFFDRALPLWPTFGLDLARFHPDHLRDGDETRNVRLARTNRDQLAERFTPIEGIGGFGHALVESVQAWMDGVYAHAPGFRDRIVKVHLDPREGGLNLRMPSARIRRLAARGYCAGLALVKEFALGGRWDNQRSVRLRNLLTGVESMAAEVNTALGADGRYQELVDRPQTAPSYPLTASQQPLARLVLRALKVLARARLRSTAGLRMRTPRPPPELRPSPRI